MGNIGVITGMILFGMICYGFGYLSCMISSHVKKARAESEIKKICDE